MFHDDDVFGSSWDPITKSMLFRMSNADLREQIQLVQRDLVVFTGVRGRCQPYDVNKRLWINTIKRIIRKRNQNKV